MKRYLGFLFLLLQIFMITVLPQEKQLFGFGSIDWGFSKDQVKGTMKENYNLLPKYETEDAVGFEGGKYFSEDIHIWVFFFVNDKLNETDLIIQNKNRPPESIFYEVVHNLSDEYGDPDLFKADDRTAQWFYFDFSGKKLTATIKVSPYSSDNMTSIKITFLKI